MKRIALSLSMAALTTLAATAGGFASRPSPTARTEAIVKTWRANLRAGVLTDPKRHFSNPSRTALTSRLRLAAHRYRFTVVKIEILHPRQAVPLVVVQAVNKHALASSAGAILHLVDPKARTGDDRTGWAYEGFLLEARDSHGVPFLAIF